MKYNIERRKAEDAIGVFDYGSGGLTVVQAIAELLPNEKFIFLADEAKINKKEDEDTTRMKKKEDAFRYADFLSNQNVKMIVVACNLMSAFAVEALQQHVDVPVIGLVQPGVLALKEHIDFSASKKIGVFTTEMAASLKLFSRIFEKAFPGIQVYEVGCPTLPKVIDDQLVGTEFADEEVQKYADQMPLDVDAVYLACTRFPILKSSFARIFPSIPIIDPAQKLAQNVCEILEEQKMLAERPEPSIFYTTGKKEIFYKVSEQLIKTNQFHVEQLNETERNK